MRDKTHTINYIAFKNNGVVISYGQHPVKLQANKGTDYTSAEVRQYDLDIGTKIAFAFLHQPSADPRKQAAGGKLANMVRGFLADSGLPKFL